MNNRYMRRVLGLARAIVSLEKITCFLQDVLLTYQNILRLSRWRVFEVQAYQVLGKPAIKGIVYLIEDEIQKVESRDERWREVDVTCNGQIHVIFRADRIGCCEN